MKEKKITAAPLPFQGQKRRFVGQFKDALRAICQDGRISTVVDLFGGSGLLSHTAKRLYSDLKVVYNDFDDFHVRLENVELTNRLLERLRGILKDYPRGRRITGEYSERVLREFAKAEKAGYVDYVTMSSSVLFSGKYVLDFEELKKQTLYNNVKQADYCVDGYLDGLEVVKMDYKDLFELYNGRPDVLFLLDPPYLSTDTKTYSSDGYWRLRDYLDVLKVLKGNNYIFFTSEKSCLVELCRWMDENDSLGNPFAGARVHTYRAQINYNSTYADYMLYKRQA